VKTQEKIPVYSLLWWNFLQKREILGSDNRWYASEKLHHPANNAECEEHYSETGGSKRFAETHYKAYMAPKPKLP
jgi:hypothetical protein